MSKRVIHNRLRELRFHTGQMTQQTLAERVGITRQTVIALEKGKYYPSLELAFRLADVFNVAVDNIFYPEPEP